MVVANLNTADEAATMFKTLADALGGVIDGDRFVVRDSAVNGICIKRELAQGLTALYLNRKNREAEYFLLQKSGSQKFFVMFAYATVPGQQTMHLQYGDVVVKKENLSWKHAFLVSSYEDVQWMLPPGFDWDNLLFVASKTWLDNNIGAGFANSLLQLYPALRTLSFDMMPITPATAGLRDKVAAMLVDRAAGEQIFPLAIILLKNYFESVALILKGMQAENANEAAVVTLVNYMQNQPESELTSPLSRKELSRKLGMSESKLGSLFKSIYGSPYSQFIIKRRMEWAAGKMANSQMSVTDVGFALGYENLSQFSASFKKHLKLLPSQFLKQNQQSG